MHAHSLPSANGDHQPPEFYKPFFLTAIFFVLTTGAAWGIWFLVEIARGGQTTSVALPHINAHGHTLIYGFFGLFICGFAMQAFPRLWGHALVAPVLCRIILACMVLGIALLFAGQMGLGSTSQGVVVVVGGALETIGVLLLVAQMWLTFRRGGSPFNAVTAAIFLGLFYFAAHTPLNAALIWAQVASESRYEAIHITSVYQPALRYLQFHGMTLLLVVAVASRLLPSFYDIPRPGNRKLWVITLVMAACVFAETAFFYAFRTTEERRYAVMLLAPWIGLLGAAVALVWPWKIWRPMRDVKGRTDRMGKFVRASFIWLIISLVMTILMPFWAMLVGTYFSHAWYGASRQVFTVGFATMMIMAFSARIVPTLNGVLPTQLTQLRGVFWLTNLGLVLHVAGQCAMDLWRPAGYILPVAGIMEFSGIALWAGHLLHCIYQGWQSRQAKDRTACPMPSVSLRVLNDH